MSKEPITTADEVLAFWFSHRDSWWKKSSAFDAEVRDRFQALHAALLRGDHDAWREEARSALAYVIVLDQLSRNMFRDSERMYVGDTPALEAARAAIERGFDARLDKVEKSFLYMPFMHSESLEDQERSVALFTAVGNDYNTGYAVQHRDIVARFGRFPHRNALLGRTSTPEETEFLKQPGSSF
ncbi:MAG: DUF924 family protein [Polyangiaceae bacterium]